MRAATLYARALVEAHLGQTECARASAEEGLVLATRANSVLVMELHHSVLGFVALSLGDPLEAHRYYGPLVQRLADIGLERCRGLLLATMVTCPARNARCYRRSSCTGALRCIRCDSSSSRARCSPWAGSSAGAHRASRARVPHPEPGDLGRPRAPLWANRAREQLARIGGRAPASVGLSPAERQVAKLVADGCTNREVAAALFLSAKLSNPT